MRQQLDQFRSLLAGADLSMTVPSCPDWNLDQLARHVGGAVRWAEFQTRTRAKEEVPLDEVPEHHGPGNGDPAGLDAWLAETAEMAFATFEEAGPDTAVWSWLPEATAGFWARRMVHELVIHRADAALATGTLFEVEPEVAVDTLDEWLEIGTWIAESGVVAPDRDLSSLPRSAVHLRATDAEPELDAAWIVEFGGGEEFRWRRGHEKAAVTVQGPLADVLLAFYRRIPPAKGQRGLLHVLGEREVLDQYLARTSFG
ncbi:maleylpyruvate isomerase family mycothiol-dependent enzyme [Streptomyces tsukubensis]|uniref:maleylpyruvate isomerase family mycothiol-dependent enzyme n=1 Tax=Streptomyces tsukubensis TaxID=83656 RepID=UPI003868D046